MKRRLRYRLRYVQDLTGIVDYISDNNRQAADQLATTCRQLAHHLTEMPERGPAVGIDSTGTLRRVIVPNFRNYLMYYRLTPDAVTIVRLLHSSRDFLSQLKESGDL